MTKPLATLIALLFLSGALGGCSKCGWFWQDGATAPHACKGDFSR